MYLGCHVSLGADAVGRRHVDRVAGPVVSHRETEVADHTTQVALD